MLTEWMETGMFKRMTFAAIAALSSAVPVAASDIVNVPEGCTALMTVHKAMCQTTTTLECGDRKEAYTFQDGKPLVIHSYAPDWSLEGFRFADGSVAEMTAVPGSGKNTDLKTMFETGSAPETGEFLFNTNIIKDRKYTLDGSLSLTGERVELGGVTFEKARLVRVFELKPGKGGLEFELDVYVSRDPDLMFEASWQRSIMGNNLEKFDQTPMSISWPGEGGYLSVKPESGCE